MPCIDDAADTDDESDVIVVVIEITAVRHSAADGKSFHYSSTDVCRCSRVSF